MKQKSIKEVKESKANRHMSYIMVVGMGVAYTSNRTQDQGIKWKYWYGSGVIPSSNRTQDPGIELKYGYGSGVIPYFPG